MQRSSLVSSPFTVLPPAPTVALVHVFPVVKALWGYSSATASSQYIFLYRGSLFHSQQPLIFPWNLSSLATDAAAPMGKQQSAANIDEAVYPLNVSTLTPSTLASSINVQVVLDALIPFSQITGYASPFVSPEPSLSCTFCSAVASVLLKSISMQYFFSTSSAGMSTMFVQKVLCSTWPSIESQHTVVRMSVVGFHARASTWI